MEFAKDFKFRFVCEYFACVRCLHLPDTPRLWRWGEAALWVNCVTGGIADIASHAILCHVLQVFFEGV